jgi:acetone carboxylase, alpha subunit
MTETDAVQFTAGQFTPQEQEFIDAFLAETTLFLGPDPEIMNDHRMAPRTAEEERLLSGPVDANDLDGSWPAWTRRSR